MLDLMVAYDSVKLTVFNCCGNGPFTRFQMIGCPGFERGEGIMMREATVAEREMYMEIGGHFTVKKHFPLAP